MALAAVALSIGSVTSGCSWVTKTRPVAAGERLTLQSTAVAVPAGAGWRASRDFDAGERWFDAEHAGSGVEYGRLAVQERDGALPLPPRAALVADVTSRLRAVLADPAAVIEEVPTTTPPKFGAAAIEVVVRAEESHAKAGLLERAVVTAGELHFVSAAGPPRTTIVRYVEASTSEGPGDFAGRWAGLLDGIALTPADPAHVAAAARAGGFPKRFRPGLAARSLTLPQFGFQAGFGLNRWLDADPDTSGSAHLALGLTDRLELDAPGFLRWSFGEPEALTGPELALGAGLTGYAHDAVGGNTWSYGVSLEARRRLASAFGIKALLLAHVVHESATGRDRGAAMATAGAAWDVHPWVSLGLEAGWIRPPDEESRNSAWVGGLRTPLLTVHLPLVDLGLTGAATWDDGALGAAAGASFLLTL